jgi:hypothetical protein
MSSTKNNLSFKKKLLKYQPKNKLLFLKKKPLENKYQFNKSLKRLLKELLKYQKSLKLKESLKNLLKNNKSLNSKLLFLNLLKFTKSLRNILIKSSKFQLFVKLSRKFQLKLKKLFKLVTLKLKSNKSKLLKKKLLYLIKSK